MSKFRHEIKKKTCFRCHDNQESSNRAHFKVKRALFVFPQVGTLFGTVRCHTQMKVPRQICIEQTFVNSENRAGERTLRSSFDTNQA